MLNALNPHLIFGIKVQILAYAIHTFLLLIKSRFHLSKFVPCKNGVGIQLPHVMGISCQI